jgi:CRP-like cAMP-binding protein
VRFRPNVGSLMSNENLSVTTNTLLNALSPADLDLLTPHFTRVSFEREKILVVANKPVEHVYFPENGLASIVATSSIGRRTEVGIFGRDGVSATHLLLGVDHSPHESFVQVAGTSALRIDVDRYLASVRQSESLRIMLLRFVQMFIIQGAQSTATNAHFRIESRLARWLLMCHDRIDGDEIALTHEFMSLMIAADRSGVTVTLHILEGAGIIRSKRGRVIILDREKLEDMAGDCYGVSENEYRALIGPLGPASPIEPAG